MELTQNSVHLMETGHRPRGSPTSAVVSGETQGWLKVAYESELILTCKGENMALWCKHLAKAQLV